jgi:citrate synthase
MNKEKLQEWQRKLIPLMIDAHYQAGFNNSISKQAFLMAYDGSQNVIQSIGSALLTIGHKHAPLATTRLMMGMFEKDKSRVIRIFANMMEEGEKIPGIGNSFYKREIDPAFQTLHDAYQDAWQDIHGEKKSILDSYCDEANEARASYYTHSGKGIPTYLFPNAAGITAACCNLVHCLDHIETAIFLAGRAQAWVEQLPQNQE